MKKPVKITTCLNCTTEGGADIIEGEFHGMYLRAEDRLMLCYDEPENGTHTRLIASDDGASLRRKGQICSLMEFLPQHKTISDYTMPEGKIRMEIHTHKIDMQMFSQHGSFEVAYTILMGGEVASENMLRIEWKPGSL